MNIVEREQELFKEWRERSVFHKGATFVEDGVVCETAFLAAKIKFVFILKEANDLRQSLTTFLRMGARTANNGNGGHTWNPVCRWLMGVDESRCYSAKERAEILSKIAVVDLKKYDEGNVVTNMKGLRRIVLGDANFAGDKDLLRKQLEIYAAYNNVIFVCCGPGMFDIVVHDIFGVDTSTIDHITKPTYYALRKTAFVMAFNHPNAHKARLASTFQQYVHAILRNEGTWSDALEEQFDSACLEDSCKGCGRKDFCIDPIKEG